MPNAVSANYFVWVTLQLLTSVPHQGGGEKKDEKETNRECFAVSSILSTDRGRRRTHNVPLCAGVVTIRWEPDRVQAARWLALTLTPFSLVLREHMYVGRLPPDAHMASNRGRSHSSVVLCCRLKKSKPSSYF